MSFPVWVFIAISLEYIKVGIGLTELLLAKRVIGSERRYQRI